MTSAAPFSASVRAPSAVLGFDTETHRTTRHDAAPRLVCVSLAGSEDTYEGVAERAPWRRQNLEDGSWVAVFDRTTGYAAFADALIHRKATLVGHNTAFDLAVLAAMSADLHGEDRLISHIFDAIDDGRIVDTQIREQLLHIATDTYEYCLGPNGVERTQFGLDDCVRRHFNIDISASKTDPMAWRLRYAELEGLPVAHWPDSAREYAALDAYWPIVVRQSQASMGGGMVDGRVLCDPTTGAMVSEGREVAAAFALHLMSVWGLRADPARVAECIEDWKKTAERGRILGEELGVVRKKGRDKGKAGSVNKKALQGLVENAYGALGLDAPRTKPSKTFKNGQVSVSTETLEECGDPELEAYAETLQATNYLTRYQWGPIMATMGALTSHPNVLVESGRTSWTNPALQQPPRKGLYRSCFVPREGWIYCGADYDIAELCSLSQVCIWTIGHSSLGDAINRGEDVHLVTAQAILAMKRDPGWNHATYDMVAGFYDSEGGTGPVTDARQAAKPVNFGFPGGLGARSFVVYAWKSYGQRFTLEEAEDLKQAWLGRYEEMPAYFRWVKAELDRGNTIEQFVSGRIRGIDRVTEGFNTCFQGLTADGAKYATYVLAKAAYTGRAPKGAPPEVRAACEAYYGARPVLFLHDEHLDEMPEDAAHYMAPAKGVIMKWAMQRHIPDVACRVKPVLMRRWLKGAKPSYDASGRLIPTEEPKRSP